MTTLQNGNPTFSEQWDTDDEQFEQFEVVEKCRFISILERQIASSGIERHRLSGILIEDYLKRSPNSDELINALIEFSARCPDPDSFNNAIDILSQLGSEIVAYGNRFLTNDVMNSSSTTRSEPYRPSDEYWYILLRSVARSEASDEERFSLVCFCDTDTKSRLMLEAVVESLGEIGTDRALQELTNYSRHDDPFIASLAAEILAEHA